MQTQDLNSNPEEAIYPEPASGNYPTQPSKSPDFNFFTRYHMVIKAILISFLTLFLMIPMALIGDLISERERTARDATVEVHQKWSGEQTIMGPVLSIPYYEFTVGKDGKKEKTMSVFQILPESLSIQGEVKTQELKRGLYEIVVYNAPIELKGHFVLPEDFSKLPEVSWNDIIFRDAMLNIGISDLRGISEQIKMQWDDRQLVFNPGVPQAMIVASGVSVHVDVASLIKDGTIDFSIELKLKGSETLRFTPVGKTTVINLQSNCTTPSFTGAFLPVDRNVTDKGFTCEWKVMNLNRNYPQVISNSRWERDIHNSELGVDMLLPVQHYQKSMRTVKYAILIIVLTFVVSFFVEIIQKKRIHPFQYLLVGAALCLFYSLLISISEHTGFMVAYGIASVMTVTMLTCYMTGVLKIKKTALAIGGLLALLYLGIFILIQLETYALVAGSIGLFVILAVIMYFSQRINWSGQS
jgi:inner membrane protein